ncbi:MAG: hypothetical protein ACKPCI_21895, partial [Dolichospermum sp.]
KPSNDDEWGLKRLKTQLQTKKVVVKLYLRHPLHAKLYLIPQNYHNLTLLGLLTIKGVSKEMLPFWSTFAMISWAIIFTHL